MFNICSTSWAGLTVEIRKTLTKFTNSLNSIQFSIFFTFFQFFFRFVWQFDFDAAAECESIWTNDANCQTNESHPMCLHTVCLHKNEMSVAVTSEKIISFPFFRLFTFSKNGFYQLIEILKKYFKFHFQKRAKKSSKHLYYSRLHCSYLQCHLVVRTSNVVWIMHNYFIFFFGLEKYPLAAITLSVHTHTRTHAICRLSSVRMRAPISVSTHFHMSSE